jgi:CBS-domain-containing membrane protein
MLFALIPVSSPIASIIIFSLTVETSMFLMAITDMEHPPACATALGIVSAGYTFSMIFAFITGVIILSSLHHILKPKLKDLV